VLFRGFLQNPEDGYNRLKRWIMIGDHHQLPPVIKNMAFQKFSNMEQSLFTRFVHLGVPTVDLDAQGRARPRSVIYLWICTNSVTLSQFQPTVSVLHYIRLNYPRLCRSAWVGIGMYRTFEAFCLSLCLSAYLSVCLFVCLSGA